MGIWVAYLVLINGMFVQINNIPSEQACEEQLKVFQDQGTYLRGVCVKHHPQYLTNEENNNDARTTHHRLSY